MDLKIRRRTADGRHLYVGTNQMTDAVATSADQFELVHDFWWVKEEKAKVWKGLGYIRQLVTKARYEETDTFSRLEIVDSEGNVTPLDDECPGGVQERRRQRPSVQAAQARKIGAGIPDEGSSAR